MNTLDKSQDELSTVEPKKGQRQLLSNNKSSSRCPFLDSNSNLPKRFNSKDEMLTAFQNLYRKHFGESISKEQALENGMNLMNFLQYMTPELDALISRKHV